MSKRNKRQFGKSEEFAVVTPEIEDEILEAYGDITVEKPDPTLAELPELLTILRIPNCFCSDLLACVDYYYEHMVEEFQLSASNNKQYITLQLLKNVTLTNGTDDPSSVLDIIDIDKLIRLLAKLVKFRDSYKLIYDSWTLFVKASNPDAVEESQIVQHRLTLPDLKKIKTSLDLDQSSDGRHALGDSFLIDMLSCCSTDSNGNITNYDFTKVKFGSSVSIKDFAEILGNLGELA